MRQKVKEKVKGQSRYHQKIAKRENLARKLGLPRETTYPVIWINQG